MKADGSFVVRHLDGSLRAYSEHGVPLSRDPYCEGDPSSSFHNLQVIEMRPEPAQVDGVRQQNEIDKAEKILAWQREIARRIREEENRTDETF